MSRSKSKVEQVKSPDIEMHYETQKIPVNKVNLNNWNPNFVPTDIIDAIRDDIIQNGFIGHIVVQKHNKKLNKDNVIINGEHRYKVFKELRGKEIPSIVLDIDDARAMALTIRLNREHGELLPNKIGEVLREISPIKNLQLLQDLTHIEQPDLAVLMDIGTGNIEAALKQNEKNRLLAQKVKIDSDKKVNCPKCGHKFEVYYG